MIAGRCLCGAVTFTLAGPPLMARACWCRDCQYLASGNASISLICDAATLRVQGPTAAYASAADSGTLMTRRFCPRCGTPLFSEAANAPGTVAVRAGTLEDRALAEPEQVIWIDSAPRWACWSAGRVPGLAPGLPTTPRHPG